jgi:hypothetical protein
MSSTRSDLIDLTLQLHHETERAILVSDDGSPDGAVWLAKSLIEFSPVRDGRIVEVTLPEWLATERGLV